MGIAAPRAPGGPHPCGALTAPLPCRGAGGAFVGPASGQTAPRGAGDRRPPPGARCLLPAGRARPVRPLLRMVRIGARHGRGRSAERPPWAAPARRRSLTGRPQPELRRVGARRPRRSSGQRRSAVTLTAAAFARHSSPPPTTPPTTARSTSGICANYSHEQPWHACYGYDGGTSPAAPMARPCSCCHFPLRCRRRSCEARWPAGRVMRS